MTSSEICPSHGTLTLSVQGHTVFYVYLCIYVSSRWIFSNYVTAMQSGHTALSGFLFELGIIKYKLLSATLYKTTCSFEEKDFTSIRQVNTAHVNSSNALLLVETSGIDVDIHCK